MKKFTLFFALVLCAFLSHAQDYVAQSIGYNPPHSYIQNNTLVNIDDIYSDVIDLEFDFEFYGATYNQIVIGSNGVINFDISLANEVCPWNFEEDIPYQAFAIKNAILGPYHDMDISVSQEAQINYGMYGTAPNRRFVVNFYENPMFSGNCNDLLATSQIVIYETTNDIDVYIRDRPACAEWNEGRGIVGIHNIDGTEGIAAPGRNASDGAWVAYNEAWRFTSFQGTTVEAYNAEFFLCDDNGDDMEPFDFALIIPEVIGTQSGVTVSFHETFLDANNNLNALVSPYINLVNPQLIFARVENGEGLYATSEVTLGVIDCIDNDDDGVDSWDEDINGDGYLGNDDTDNDGIPNYLDPDDDNDNVDTQLEITGIGAGLQGGYAFIDTDEDGLENYLDNDDDGDGINSRREDYNLNGNLLDDDTNGNNIPDFLDPEVAIILSVTDTGLLEFRLWPNPSTDQVLLSTSEIFENGTIAVYNTRGQLLIQNNFDTASKEMTIDISTLANGIYFVELSSETKRMTKQLIKQ